MRGPRMTMQTLVVLRAFLDDPERELYGLEIATHTGLLPGTTYPILVRLERADWVTSRWEDIDPRDEQRPARRYYKLTSRGGELARQELDRRSRGTVSAARPWKWNALGVAATREVRPGGDATRPWS